MLTDCSENPIQLLTELLKLINSYNRKLIDIEDLIMATQEELAQQLNALNDKLTNISAQIGKVSGEVQGAAAAQAAAIQALTDQLAAANNLSPEAQAALDKVLATTDQLAAATQGLDDLNPDPAPADPAPAEPATDAPA